MIEPGLRERKKTQTRRALQDAALRLFDERGFGGTTVEDIAAAANVSPRTFFRYFDSKEDAVLWDEYDPIFFAAFQQESIETSVVDAFRAAFRTVMVPFVERDKERLLTRARLIFRTPEIRAKLNEANGALFDEARRVFSTRYGGDPDSLEARLIVAVLIAAFMEVANEWQRTDGRSDIGDLVERALDFIANIDVGRPPDPARSAGRSRS